MKSKLVPDRICGECNACCIALLVDEPDIQKPADIPCKNLDVGGGCKIYSSRPSICSSWHCAWRFMSQLGEEWRPDKSGIIIRFGNKGLILHALTDPVGTLTSHMVLELIGGGIENNVQLSISVETKKGFQHALVSINEQLEPTVSTNDLNATKQTMTALIQNAICLDTPPV